ncbi:hypothetical protein K9M79_02460 [Candidatus Woesearchaeota archaeon]|nr:hypothetical protein [Candidatus Woesearchaeota archaeon]
MKRTILALMMCIFLANLSYSVPFNPNVEFHPLQQVTTDDTGSVSVDSDADSIIDQCEGMYCGDANSCYVNSNFNGQLTLQTTADNHVDLELRKGVDFGRLGLNKDDHFLALSVGSDSSPKWNVLKIYPTASSNLLQLVGNTVRIGGDSTLTDPALHVIGSGDQVYIDTDSSGQPASISFLESGTKRWSMGNNPAWSSSDDFYLLREGSCQPSLASCQTLDGMTIDSSTGNIGIGTTNADVKLTVNGAIRIKPTTAPSCVPASSGTIYYDSGDDHFYGCNGNSWMRLDTRYT